MPVLFILSIELDIDFLSLSKVIDTIGYLYNETLNDFNHSVSFVMFSSLFIMHENHRTFVLDITIYEHFIALFLLFEILHNFREFCLNAPKFTLDYSHITEVPIHILL